MTRVYYKEAVGAFIVFDVTRADSFRAVDKWKADLDTKVKDKSLVVLYHEITLQYSQFKEI